MIVVLKQNSDKGHVERLMQHFTDMGLRIQLFRGAQIPPSPGLMGDGQLKGHDVVGVYSA